MNVNKLKAYFRTREFGLQGTVGEYAILVPLVERDGELFLLFETRARTLVGHQPNEVCFPGGRVEPGETPRETALRETMEELLLPEDQIRVIAPLFKLTGPGGTLEEYFPDGKLSVTKPWSYLGPQKV